MTMPMIVADGLILLHDYRWTKLLLTGIPILSIRAPQHVLTNCCVTGVARSSVMLVRLVSIYKPRF